MSRSMPTASYEVYQAPSAGADRWIKNQKQNGAKNQFHIFAREAKYALFRVGVEVTLASCSVAAVLRG